MRADTGLIDPVAEAKGALELLPSWFRPGSSWTCSCGSVRKPRRRRAAGAQPAQAHRRAGRRDRQGVKATLTDAAGDADAAANYIARFEEAETERRLSSMLYSTALDGLERSRLNRSGRRTISRCSRRPIFPKAHRPRVLGNALALFAAALLLRGGFSFSRSPPRGRSWAGDAVQHRRGIAATICRAGCCPTTPRASRG